MRDIEVREGRFLAVSLKTAMIVTVMTNILASGFVSVSRPMFGKLRGFPTTTAFFRTDSFRKSPSLGWLKTLLFFRCEYVWIDVVSVVMINGQWRSMELATLLSLFHGTDERVPIGTIGLTAKGYMELVRRFLS